VRRFKRQLFFLSVSISILICSILFFPWFRPRETVCGIMGRWETRERGWKRIFGRLGAAFFDATIHNDNEKCHVIYEMEEAARGQLYIVSRERR